MIAGGRNPPELHTLSGQGQRACVVAQPRAAGHPLHQPLRIWWVHDLGVLSVLGCNQSSGTKAVAQPRAA